MKAITQSAEIAFYALSTQDVVTLLPLMDTLCGNRALYLKNWKEDEEEKKDGYYYKKLVEVEEQLNVLLNLGFIPSSSSMLQNFPLNI